MTTRAGRIDGRRDIVALGASAGGVPAIRHLLSRIPAPFPGAIFAVIHRSPYFESRLPAVLRGTSGHVVTEPADRARVEPGRVYLAPADLHLVLEGERMRALRGPKEHFTRPAVDPLFRSVAASYGHRVVGVVLTGGGADGLDGLIAIKAAGGLAIAQTPAEAQLESMPAYAIAGDNVDAVLTLDEIAATITQLVDGRRRDVG